MLGHKKSGDGTYEEKEYFSVFSSDIHIVLKREVVTFAKKQKIYNLIAQKCDKYPIQNGKNSRKYECIQNYVPFRFYFQKMY